MSVVTPVVRQWIEEGLTHPDDFWARAATRAALVSPVGSGVRVELPDVPLVRRRRNESRLQRARPPRRRRPRQSHRSHLHERARRAPPVHLHRAARAGRTDRGRAACARHRQRRSSDDLHADIAGSDRVDAGHRPHRRYSLRRLCGFWRQCARRSHQRQRVAVGVRWQT